MGSSVTTTQRHLAWRQARDETLELWRKIRRMLDEPDGLELLTEVNAICALCEAANQEEAPDLTRCERCLAFQQFGGCQQINLEMSERIVERNWGALRDLVDVFIHNLETLELPPESAPAG